MKMKTEKYLSLKRNLAFSYSQVKVERVMAFHIWKLANGEMPKVKYWDLVKIAFSSINFKELSFLADNHKILSTFGIPGRRDHFALYNNVIARLDGKASVNDVTKISNTFSFNLRVLFNVVFRFLPKIIKAELKFEHKLFVFAVSIYYCNSIVNISKLDLSKVSAYFSMLSILDRENLLTQHFKKIGKKTFSLQDGILLDPKVTDTIDFLQVENLESEEVLVWGEYSRIMYENNRSDITARIAGFPRDAVRTEVKQVNQFKKCLVLLARNSFEDANQALIKILKKEKNIEFFLKLHPSLNQDVYTQINLLPNISVITENLSLSEVISNNTFDLSISVNTTAYYECLLCGIPSLRFKHDSFSLLPGLEDTFDNVDQMETQIKKIETHGAEAYNALVEEILNFVIGFKYDNYKTFLLSNAL